MKSPLWNRDELILTLNLYYKLPFGKLHNRNPAIIKLSNLIGRSPSSVTWKLVNFASFDPSLKARGIKGAVNTGKLDKLVWDEFYQNIDELAYQSERQLAFLENKSIEQMAGVENLPIREGKEKERLIKVRINQSFFRASVLASYNFTCCITGISTSELLIASHIMTWASDHSNRLNPRNGLCLNALHDRAYESGLIAITPDYKIKVSPKLKKGKDHASLRQYFLKHENKSIILPTKFLPDPDFLAHHLKNRFQD